MQKAEFPHFKARHLDDAATSGALPHLRASQKTLSPLDCASRRGDAARGRMPDGRGAGYHRTVHADGRALREAGEPEKAGGLGDLEVGERVMNPICTTRPSILYNGRAPER